jgi:tripartite-type tricarboxylate transporter receptor subunit TctC
VRLRIVAEALTRLWGQQVLPLNHPGGGGAVAARIAAAAPPDGHTLYIPALSVFVAPPGAAAPLPLAVPRDFAAVGFIGGAPLFISAAASLGVRTLPDLLALAKARPGELAYGTNGRGRLTHLTGELLQSRAGIRLLMVPYLGGAAHALNDVMGGRIHIVIEGYSGIAGAVQSGALVPLAVAGRERDANFPDLPTVAESIPDFVAMGWQVLVAPLGTPDTIVRKVSDDLRRVQGQPDLRARFAALGTGVRSMSPAEVTAFIAEEQRKWAPLLRQIAGSP